MLEHSMSLASTELLLRYEELNLMSVNFKKKIKQNAKSAVSNSDNYCMKRQVYFSSDLYQSYKAVVI
jgi:hypothetical protein